MSDTTSFRSVLRGYDPAQVDQWQAEHLVDPRSVVPESIMPGYPWLARTKLDTSDVVQRLKTLKLVGVPYTDEMIDKASRAHVPD